MHRHVRVALSALTLVAALGLAGCSLGASNTSSSAAPSTPPAAASAVAAPPNTALPAPEALTDVLSRLADPTVAGINKLNLVEGSTPETADALDRFTTAARDGGYLPMTFAATDVAWSDKNPSDVTAIVVVTTAAENNRAFTFPMEFAPFHGGWQLSRKTAEMLLALGNSGGVRPPAPSPTP
ncbi:hypothetical protein H7H78_05155 [Mycobacterium shinjukuense]|nr:hypothetical protein [Mycobacterium shinjukuense]MCV6984849.1 hypothetical protein [Mycobacterium shinjukuense]ORB66428.1 hypothetical protein BST45_14180 [Mycobacterium shinjukuense]